MPPLRMLLATLVLPLVSSASVPPGARTDQPNKIPSIVAVNDTRGPKASHVSKSEEQVLVHGQGEIRRRMMAMQEHLESRVGAEEMSNMHQEIIASAVVMCAVGILFLVFAAVTVFAIVDTAAKASLSSRMGIRTKTSALASEQGGLNATGAARPRRGSQYEEESA